MSDVTIERTLSAPPERVYRAWLEPVTLQRWLHPGEFRTTEAEVDARVGGRVRIVQSDADGTAVGGSEAEIVELVPDEKIVLRWWFVGADRATPPDQETRLSISLRPGRDAGTTVLTLVHDRLDGLLAAAPDMLEGVEAGWADVLDQLPTALEA